MFFSQRGRGHPSAQNVFYAREENHIDLVLKTVLFLQFTGQ